MRMPFHWFALIASLLSFSIAWADNSSAPSKPFTFTAGTTILSSQVNSDFDTLYVGLANVGTANIIASGVGTTQLANASVTTGKLDATVSAALNPTGTILDYIGTTAPTGYVLADGKTIGDASSGGTERANADTSTLYSLLWGAMADAQAPVSSGRGGSAAADFAAHKTITLPDLRGRIVVGKDNMGGTAAARMTSAAGGVDGATNGAVGGTQTVTLTTAQIPSHTHPIASSAHTHTFEQTTYGVNSGGTPLVAMVPVGSGGASSGNSSAASPTLSTATSATGGGTAHANVPPAIVLYRIIKL